MARIPIGAFFEGGVPIFQTTFDEHEKPISRLYTVHDRNGEERMYVDSDASGTWDTMLWPNRPEMDIMLHDCWVKVTKSRGKVYRLTQTGTQREVRFSDGLWNEVD
jgi:hypothetical protein